jgi:hypothetical protein
VNRIGRSTIICLLIATAPIGLSWPAIFRLNSPVWTSRQISKWNLPANFLAAPIAEASMLSQ